MSPRNADTPADDLPASTPLLPEEGLAGFRELDEEALGAVEAIGVDSGATLVKLCIEDPQTGIHLATWPAPSIERVLEILERLAPRRVGVTGCGTRAITSQLPRAVAAPLEFDAWVAGPIDCSRRSGARRPAPTCWSRSGPGHRRCASTATASSV